jgi:hypothetical protein
MTFALLLIGVVIATLDSSLAVWAWQRIAWVAFKANPVIRMAPILKAGLNIEDTPPSFDVEFVNCQSRWD